MILVINGTNRQDNKTSVVSKFVFDWLSKNSLSEVKYYSLEELPALFNLAEMYEAEKQHPQISKIQNNLFIPSDSWIIISPEYNGSFPGILKLTFDALSVRKLSETFHHKKVGLIGVSDGRAGNIRGMDHLTAMLNYLKMTVYHNKLPISSAKTMIDHSQLQTPTTKILEDYLTEFIHWLK
ncbi:MAG TPA: NAD(P)H-dependent oxidoreductase [Saprospiraceae bacterium]|nr:NAD(P)H-dependent oxidoreductase [Saprospiraceae bacterium]